MADARSNDSDSDSRVFAGRFAYEKPLGKGAGGAVYLAEDLHNDRRRVALKVLSKDAYESVQGKMLRREFEILSKLDHPNLVRVYDYGALPGGGVYLAEEYIDGFSLQDARALLEPETHVEITRQVLMGLAYLHGMGMIHRDVKPANVMLLWLNEESTRPMVKLVDFGLSSMDPSKDTLRGGTRSYMAPEIIDGNKGEFRSDLFSLGVTLYYALCGVLPFGPRSKEDPPPTEENIDPPPPHRFNPDVPLTLSRLTQVLLRQVGGVEFDDAGEALQALARDTEPTEWWAGRRLADSFDIAAAPVLRGYFERGILGRRVGERERLVEAVVGDESSNRGIFHFIRGRPEVGKSRLISEVTASLKIEGCRVVRVDCHEGMHSWELVHELLERIVELGASRGLRDIEYYESYLLILERLATLDSDAETQLSQAVDHEWLRRAFHDAVAALEPERLVVVIEDIDAGDIASRRFLAGCYGPDEGLRMPAAIATGLRDMPHAFFTEGDRVIYHQIEGLTRSDLHRFFESRLGLDELPDDWLEAIDEHADGQPAYLEELCRTLADDGYLRRLSVSSWDLDRAALEDFSLPESLRASFRRRFASLGASGRELLEMLSLFERPVRWETLRGFIESNHDSVGEAEQKLESLCRRDLAKMNIEVDGRYLELVDEVLGEVVLDLMSPSWKRALHRRIAARLYDDWQEGGVEPAEVARHRALADEEASAAEMFETAGDRMWDRADFGATYGYYRQALEAVDTAPARAFLLAKQAEVRMALFDPERSGAMITEAGQIAERAGLDWLVNSVCLTGADLSLIIGDDQGVDQWVSRLEDCLPSAGQQAPALELKAAVARRRGEFDRASSLLEQAVRRVRHFGQLDRLAGILARQADVRAWQGDTAEAGALFDEALEAAGRFGDELRSAEINFRRGVALRREHSYGAAAESLERSLETLAQGYRPDLWIEALVQVALCKANLTDLGAAQRYASDALVFANEFGNEVLIQRVRFCRAELALIDTDEAGPILESMRQAIDQVADSGTVVPDRLEMTLRYVKRSRSFGHTPDESVVDAARRQVEQLGIASLG